MSIQEILSKVIREPRSETPPLASELTNVNILGESLAQKDSDSLTVLPFHQLLEKYSMLKSWLETHECQSGTGNKMDVNDRPYDHGAYQTKLKELKNTVSEIFIRPLTDGLVEQVKKYGL
jgi:hypothetical protein